jgi:hypothetical protein
MIIRIRNTSRHSIFLSISHLVVFKICRGLCCTQGGARRKNSHHYGGENNNHHLTKEIKFDVSKKTKFLEYLSGSRIHFCRFLTLQPLNAFGFTSGDDKTLIKSENFKETLKKPRISISTPKA